MIHLVVQVPDAVDLTDVLDAAPLREVARELGCYLVAIEDGQHWTVPLTAGGGDGR